VITTNYRWQIPTVNSASRIVTRFILAIMGNEDVDTRLKWSQARVTDPVTCNDHTDTVNAVSSEHGSETELRDDLTWSYALLCLRVERPAVLIQASEIAASLS
jgi:hypothetical protein